MGNGATAIFLHCAIWLINGDLGLGSLLWVTGFYGHLVCLTTRVQNHWSSSTENACSQINVRCREVCEEGLSILISLNNYCYKVTEENFCCCFFFKKQTNKEKDRECCLAVCNICNYMSSNISSNFP